MHKGSSSSQIRSPPGGPSKGLGGSAPARLRLPEAGSIGSHSHSQTWRTAMRLLAELGVSRPPSAHEWTVYHHRDL